MLEWLETIDHQLLLAINGAHTPFLDVIMWWASNKFVWFPFYLLLFFFVYRKYSLKEAIWFTVFGLAAVGFCDFTTTHLVKDTVMRYRPSHNLLLENLLHYHQYPDGNYYHGGMYGFFSGHASNSCVIALFFIYQLRSKVKYILPILMVWLALICYSRMYLGVHYPSDIFCGLIWGGIVSTVFYWGYKQTIHKGEF